MTSNDGSNDNSNNNKEAFVWIWLPEETKPIVAGRLEADGGNILFNYGKKLS